MQRKSVVGTRSSLLWLLILGIVVLLIGAVVGALIVLPQLQAARAEQARLAEIERHYQAGVAFQNVEDWTAAEGEYRQVISLDASYKDAQTRLAEAKTKLAARDATVTAVAAAQTAQARADATAMALAVPTATAQALDTRYQRALGLVNLKQWVEAQAELRAVFDVDPNYKDVQAQLALAADALSRQTPTSTPIPANTPTPAVVVAANVAPQGKVEVSSVYPYQPADCFSGAKAIDGVVEDTSCHSWATNGEGVGAWLKITFPTVRHVNLVILYDRPNPTDQVLQGKLTFSDGTELQTGDLPNGGAPRKLSFEQKNVTWIRFTVVQSTGPNIGLGEIEIYGW